MDLPKDFLTRMEHILGAEYGAFLDSCAEPRKFGLRVNTLKITVEEFQRLAPFHLTPIPWTENGFYYEKEDDPARHPFYSAGLYYLQEPSAMAPASVLSVKPGERVLDLCAAPGGKATALGAALKGKGLLVANDISASRAKALLKNLEVSGITNAYVTNARPDQMAAQFPEGFDKILVDAPCSGEGMFRKDRANADAWSLGKVGECARLQREIVGQAVGMLRPGGQMLYSTCTFSPEEDEGTVAWLLEACPEMELLDIPWQEGCSPGRADLAEELWKGDCAFGEGSLLPIPGGHKLWEESPGDRVFGELVKCVRMYPHRMGGEGHFLALLRKRGSTPAALPGADFHIPQGGGSRQGTEGYLAGSSLNGRGPGARKLAAEEQAALQAFFRDVAPSFAAGILEVRKGQVYAVPAALQFSGALPFLRNGLYAGEIRNGRFLPSQSLAMALTKGQYASTLDFPQDDPRVRRYLRGETVQTEGLHPARAGGWQLVCVSGYPLGWGKLVEGTLKNKYHPGWRMK